MVFRHVAARSRPLALPRSRFVQSRPVPPTNTEPRKRPRQARSRVLFDALVEATQRVLANEGVEAVTTAHVAEVAGVSIGSLYQYFPSREALIAAVIDHKLEADIRELLPAIEALRQASLDDAIRGLVELTVRFYRDETPLYREMIAAMAAVDREVHVRRTIEGLDGVIVQVLAPHREQLSADLDECAWVMRTAMLACVREAAMHRPEALQDGKLSAQLEAMCAGLLGKR
jgi:AcrR family transcriptional regulator